MDSLILVSRDKSTQIVSAPRQNPFTSSCTSFFRVFEANFYTCPRSIYHTPETAYLTLSLRFVHERMRNPVEESSGIVLCRFDLPLVRLLGLSSLARFVAREK